MNLFRRHQRRLRRRLIIAFIVLILGVTLMIVGAKLPSPQTEPLDVYESGVYGSIQIGRLLGEFEQNVKQNHYYYLAQLEDGSLLVLRGGRAQQTTWQRHIASGNKDPLYTAGRLHRMDADLREMTEDYMELLALPEASSAVTTTYYLRIGAPKSVGFGLFTVGIFAFPISLLLILWSVISWLTGKRTERYIESKYPEYDSFRFLDEYRDFEIPSLKLFIKDDLLVVEHALFSAVDLSDVAWIYVGTIPGRSLSRAFLRVFSKTKKNKSRLVFLPGKQSRALRTIEPLFTYLEEHHPTILLGQKSEHKKRYRDTFS